MSENEKMTINPSEFYQAIGELYMQNWKSGQRLFFVQQERGALLKENEELKKAQKKEKTS